MKFSQERESDIQTHNTYLDILWMNITVGLALSYKYFEEIIEHCSLNHPEKTDCEVNTDWCLIDGLVHLIEDNVRDQNKQPFDQS